MSLAAGLAAILNAKLLLATITKMRRITVSYPSDDTALIAAFDITASPWCVWDCSHSVKSLSIRDQKLDLAV